MTLTSISCKQKSTDSEQGALTGRTTRRRSPRQALDRWADMPCCAGTGVESQPNTQVIISKACYKEPEATANGGEGCSGARWSPNRQTESRITAPSSSRRTPNILVCRVSSPWCFFNSSPDCFRLSTGYNAAGRRGPPLRPPVSSVGASPCTSTPPQSSCCAC